MKAFIDKFSSIFRDLEIFTVPRIVGRMKTLVILKFTLEMYPPMLCNHDLQS